MEVADAWSIYWFISFLFFYISIYLYIFMLSFFSWQSSNVSISLSRCLFEADACQCGKEFTPLFGLVDFLPSHYICNDQKMTGACFLSPQIILHTKLGDGFPLFYIYMQCISLSISQYFDFVCRGKGFWAFSSQFFCSLFPLSLVFKFVRSISCSVSLFFFAIA